MDLEVTILGNLTLPQTEERCKSEQLGGYKLDSITFGTAFEGGNVKLVNKAAFFEANSTQILTNLKLRELGADDANALKADMKAQSWIFICDSHIYVQDQLKRVLVFGKN